MKSERGTESSVQVRLAEVMALEQERIAKTEEKERQEESERLRHTCGAEAAHRREEAPRKQGGEARQRDADQALRDAETKRQHERETALTRIRLEAESREAAKRQEMLWRHEVALQRMRMESGHGNGWRNAALALLASLIAGITIHAGVIHPRLLASAASVPRREAHAARAEALAYKTRNAILSEQIAQLEAEIARPRPTPPSDARGNRRARGEVMRLRAPEGVGAHRPGSRAVSRIPTSPLDSLDFDSTDPLTGLDPELPPSSAR